MTELVFNRIDSILKKQQLNSELDFENAGETRFNSTNLASLIESETRQDAPELRQRILDELTGMGPLANLIHNSEITEILVNKHDQIFYEKNGGLFENEDHFFSESSYHAFIDRLSQKCHTYMSREKPFVEAQLEHLRITFIFSELSRGHHLIAIRKQPASAWTLEKLREKNWCTDFQMEKIKEIIQQRKNFLVIGGTGSGKTSFLQAILQSLPPLERTVMIEDTQELHPPNQVSASLLTRQDPGQAVKDVTMDDLLKRALRLRPDRLVVGEIRGAEAKSLLMALATGHDGSFGSLHAKNPAEALLRLEMLIQMGAPQWTLNSIRKLMAMTVHTIFVIEKKDGQRRLEGIYQVTSLEENGLTLERIDYNF